MAIVCGCAMNKFHRQSLNIYRQQIKSIAVQGKSPTFEADSS